jgi:hypothetical protein
MDRWKMGNSLSEIKSVPFLILLNRQIELVPHIIDISLNGLSRYLELFGERRTIRSALGFDGPVDLFHAGHGHPGNRYAQRSSSRHEQRYYLSCRAAKRQKISRKDAKTQRKAKNRNSREKAQKAQKQTADERGFTQIILILSRS